MARNAIVFLSHFFCPDHLLALMSHFRTASGRTIEERERAWLRSILRVVFWGLLVGLAPVWGADPGRYYPLDGDTKDRATNRADATIRQIGRETTIGSEYYPCTPSVLSTGVSLCLPGTSERLEVADPRFAGACALTISLWVMFPQDPLAMESTSLFLGTTASGEYVIWTTQIRLNEAGKFEHDVWDDSVSAGRKVIGSAVVKPGTWYHLVTTVQNNGRMRLYVNGVAEPSSMGVGRFQTGTRFLLDTGAGGGGASGESSRSTPGPVMLSHLAI